MGASGSSSDAQIFNHSKLKRRTEGWDYHHLNHLDLGAKSKSKPYALAGQAIQYTTTDQGGGNNQLQDIQWEEVVKNSFGIFVNRSRVLLTTMEQSPKVVRDIVLTCVLLHNMLRSHQAGADRPPAPADDIQPPQADQGEQGPNENLRNPSRGAQTSMRPAERLLQSRGGTGWAGQSLRRLRAEHAVIYQSFSGLLK